MKVEPLSGREKNVIILGITFSVIALLAVYLILPYWDKYQSLSLDFNSKSRTLANLKQEEKNITLNKKKIEEARAAIRELKGRLPDNPANAELYYFINRAAGESAVVLENITMNKSGEKKTAAKQENNSMTAVPVEITVSGSYPGLRTFTKKIQDLKRVNSLHNVDIYMDPSNKLTAKLSIDAFTVKTSETDKTGNTDIPAAVLTKADPFI